jgi:hypothetical protein
VVSTRDNKVLISNFFFFFFFVGAGIASIFLHEQVKLLINMHDS